MIARRYEHETALRSAFQNLLEQLGRQFGWTLIPELSDKAAGKSIRPDGTFRDDYYITRGHWEAKDSHDHLETEIKKKIAKGYPTGNIIFEDTRQAQLYQNGEQAMVVDLTDAQAACRPAQRVLRLHGAGPREFRQGDRRIQGARAGPGPGAGREDQGGAQRQPEVHRGIRGILRALPQLAQPELEPGRRGRDAGAAPLDRAADPHDFRQPGFHPPQRDRRGGRKGDRRPGLEIVQPARLSQIARPLLPGDRVGRGHDRELCREAALFEHGL